jgi:hypothetical protein
LIGDGNASDRYFRSCLAANVAQNQYKPDPMPVYAAGQIRVAVNKDRQGARLTIPESFLLRADEVIEL